MPMNMNEEKRVITVTVMTLNVLVCLFSSIFAKFLIKQQKSVKELFMLDHIKR